jgi:hypothetical protein
MAGIISASTAAMISAGASVGGLGLNAVGKLKGGQAGGAAAAYQAQVARNNAIALRQMADRTIQGGLVNADVTSLRSGANVGAIKAKQGASGLNVNKGSAVDVRAGAAAAGKFDAETVLSNADLTAYGYRVKASQEEAQAGLYEMGGGQAVAAGQIGAAGSLLGAASAVPWTSIFGKGDSGVTSTQVGGPDGFGGLAGALPW